MDTKRIVGGLSVAALLLLGSGCGKLAEKAVEKGTEKAIEDQTGGDADFDLDSGKVKVSDGEGGSFEVDGDGNVKVEGRDGETSIDTGDGAKVPADWPEALLPPEGAKILSATSSTAAGSELLSVTAELDATVDEAYEGFKQQLIDAGFDITNDSNGDANGAAYANLIASDGTNDVVASFGDNSGTTAANISITPAN